MIRVILALLTAVILSGCVVTTKRNIQVAETQWWTLGYLQSNIECEQILREKTR